MRPDAPLVPAIPAFMSTRHRAHVVARVVSDASTTPTTLTRQHDIGLPPGLSFDSRSLSSQFASQWRASAAADCSQRQQGNAMRSSGMDQFTVTLRTKGFGRSTTSSAPISGRARRCRHGLPSEPGREVEDLVDEAQEVGPGGIHTAQRGASLNAIPP